MIGKSKLINVEDADIIGLNALKFLAEEPDRMGRFIALTGIGPQTLRTDAETPAILAAVLNHLMQDESTLLMFCAENRIDPDLVAPAHACLSKKASGGTDTGTPGPHAS